MCPQQSDYQTLADTGMTDIVIIADGWKKSTFDQLIEEGSLHEIQEDYLSEGHLIKNVISNVPSVSIASHASILTSSFQDQHKIPGHRWQASDCSCCRNYLSLRGPHYVNRDLSLDVTTFLEDAPTGMARIAVQSVIRRGADVQSSLLSQKASPILGKLGDLAIDNPYSRAVAWLPRVDSLSHIHGPDSPLVKEEMKQTSLQLGVLATRMRKAGIWDSSRILLIPDHGHRSISYHTSLKRVFNRIGVNIAVNPSHASERKITARTSGDGSAYIYMPRKDATYIDEIAEYLASCPEIALSCLRMGNTVTFRSKTGCSVATLKDESLHDYYITSGDDPIGYAHRSVMERNPLKTPQLGRFPDFLHQYLRSHVNGRSAELLIFAENDTHFGVTPRVGWRLGYHRGTHGGPSVDEVVVSAVYKGEADIDSEAPTRSADILKVLGFKALSAGEARNVHSSSYGWL